MKKILWLRYFLYQPASLFCLFILLIGHFLAVPVALATFADQYQNYLQIYDSYKTAYQGYVTTRNQFLTYGTLTSKNDALTAVKVFLTERDTVLFSYLGLLQAKNTDQVFSSLLTTEANFMTNHSSQVGAIGSLEDAVTAAEEVENKHIPLQILSRQVVTSVIMSKINTVKLAYTVSENEAGNLIATLKSNGKDVSILERWLLESKNKELQAEQKLQEAATSITRLAGFNENDIPESYNKTQSTLLEANQYLKEALQFLKEAAAAIKYGEY